MPSPPVSKLAAMIVPGTATGAPRNGVSADSNSRRSSGSINDVAEHRPVPPGSASRLRMAFWMTRAPERDIDIRKAHSPPIDQRVCLNENRPHSIFFSRSRGRWGDSESTPRRKSLGKTAEICVERGAVPGWLRLKQASGPR